MLLVVTVVQMSKVLTVAAKTKSLMMETARASTWTYSQERTTITELKNFARLPKIFELPNLNNAKP